MEIPHFCAASSTVMYSIQTFFAQYYSTLYETYQSELDIKNQHITFVSLPTAFLKMRWELQPLVRRRKYPPSSGL
jgi:hypothetical protein